jgi:hypothetical protein
MLCNWLGTRAGFSVVEADARIHWRLRGAPSFDPLAPSGPFTTLVAFLPPAFAARLTSVIDTLPGISEHFRYPPAQLHVTIRNLDGADLSALPALLAGTRPLLLGDVGLGFTRETLLLRLRTDKVLRRLRARLDGIAGIRPPRQPLRRLAFANVLRLDAPVAGELLRSAREHRDALGGEQLKLDELTLVSTDKVGSPDRTEILARYPLPAP